MINWKTTDGKGFYFKGHQQGFLSTKTEGNYVFRIKTCVIHRGSFNIWAGSFDACAHSFGPGLIPESGKPRGILTSVSGDLSRVYLPNVAYTEIYHVLQKQRGLPTETKTQN